MSKHLKSVMTVLKTKSKAFGFSKKELESVASMIDDNLSLEDDASDEDVNAEITKQVDAVIPFLKLSQSAASRAIQAYKDSHKVEEEEEEEEEEEVEETTTATKKNGKNKSTKNKENENPQMKKLLEAVTNLTAEVAGLKGEKKTSERRSRLEELVKDTGSFGKRELKNFSKMSFKDEDEFEDYLSGVEEDLKAYNQERADEGLSALGKSENGNEGGKGKNKKDEEPMTDEEIEKLAESFS